MTDEIDEMVRAAAKAHEGLAGADYFDGFSAKVLARLDRHESFASEVPMMSSDTPPSKDSKAGGDEPPKPLAGNTDDSGLHDMKALAETAKRRISRRITSQHDAYDESLLSSSTSGLRAVALPVAAQVVSLPDLPVATPHGSASEPASVTPISAAAEKKKNKNAFVIGGVLLAAAAAAVVVVAAGGKKNASDEPQAVAAKQEATDRMATGAAPATGAAAAGEYAAAPAMPPPPSEAMAQIAAPDPQAPAADKLEDKDAGKLKEEEKSARVRGDSAAPPADKGRKEDGKASAGGGTGAGSGTTDRPKKPGAGDKTGGDKAGGGGAPAGGGGGQQSIDDLLNAASGGAQKPTEGGGGDSGGEIKPEKTRLDTKDIKAGMSAVAGKAQSCFDQHGVAGLVKVKATVEPGGSVTKVEATGEFAGTPTGSCVAGHVKGAKFATWTGAPMTISYGFTLQE